MNFKLNFENTENFYFLLTQTSPLEIKEEDTYIRIDKNFPAPIQEIYIKFDFNINNKNEISLLGIIKKDILACLKSENSSFEEFDKSSLSLKIFSLRKIENFGIYIFAGRPDLSLEKEDCLYIKLENPENFKNILMEFCQILENVVNNIYKQTQTEFNYNFAHRFKGLEKKEIDFTQEEEKEIPEALKRFYKRIGKSV